MENENSKDKIETDRKNDFQFKCLMCGRCCHEIPGLREHNEYKRIPIYPEEADRLEFLAKERNVPLKLIEDLVFPDTKNEKILVLTWRIMLDNEEEVCPFFSTKTGCTIHEQKPLACQAYPLAIKSEDAFNMKIEIAPLCSFTEKHYDLLKSMDFKKFKAIYAEECALAKKLLNRNKSAIMELTGKERLGLVVIPREILPEDYNNYLQNWERETL